MRSILAVPFVLVLLGGVAFARAPTREDLPTVRDVMRRMDREEELIQRRAEEANRDDKMDRIKAWEDGRAQVTEVKFLLDIIKDEKEERKYRYQATVAIRNRLKDMPAADQKIRKLKQQIGLELVGLLTDNDDDVPVWVAAIFREFWPGEYTKSGYDPKDPYLKRLKAAREWRKFLSSR